MKTREQYIKPYLEDLEDYVESVEKACKAFGYKNIDDAYQNSMNDWLLGYIDGIYEYEKQLIRAHKKYDRILEKLASKNKVVGKKSFEADEQEEN